MHCVGLAILWSCSFLGTTNVQAASTNRTIDYVFTVNGFIGTWSDTQYFACGPANYTSSYVSGCDVSATWKIVGTCDDPLLYVHVLKGDYGSSVEYIYVIIDDYDYNYCYGTTSECSNATDCRFANDNYTHVSDYNSSTGDYYLKLNKFIDSNKQNNVVSVTLDSSSSVDGDCDGANNYVLRAYVTIGCSKNGNFTYAPTEMPTPAPTPEPFVFDVEQDGSIQSDTQYLSCGRDGNLSYISGCAATGTWKIRGYCSDATLNAYVLAGDYGHSVEYIDIDINGDTANAQRCNGLNGECIGDSQCRFNDTLSGYDNTYLDISNYVDEAADINYIQISLESSSWVDGDCDGANNNVVRAYVTINCASSEITTTSIAPGSTTASTTNINSDDSTTAGIQSRCYVNGLALLSSLLLTGLLN